MISNRLKKIASLINKEDKVLDIGTDHAFIPIYLISNDICLVADGSDISPNVVSIARNNVSRYNLSEKINIIQSDGTKNVDIKLYNTLIIAGMGFFTIKNILENTSLDNIKKIIVQCNSDLRLFREYLYNNNFTISCEYIIKDKNKNYFIFDIIPNKKEINKINFYYGEYKSENKWFYEEEFNKLSKILNDVANNGSIISSEICDRFSVIKEYMSK